MMNTLLTNDVPTDFDQAQNPRLPSWPPAGFECSVSDFPACVHKQALHVLSFVFCRKLLLTLVREKAKMNTTSHHLAAS